MASLDSAHAGQMIFKGNVINLFPNPVSTSLYLQLTTLPSNETMTVTLISAEGKVMIQQTVTTLETELKMESYSAGFYFVRLTQGAHTKAWQVVKE